MTCIHCSQPILEKYVQNTMGLFHPSCSPIQRELMDKQCRICNVLLTGEVSFLQDSDGYYHPSCCKCVICKTPIKGSFIKDINGKQLHIECQRCQRCGSVLDRNHRCSNVRFKICFTSTNQFTRNFMAKSVTNAKVLLESTSLF